MQAPTRVYVFDHAVEGDPADVRAMNARVAACYAWADAHGVRVVDEVIVWQNHASTLVGALSEVAVACHRAHAGLLVHSVAALADGADQVRVPEAGTGPVGLLVVVADADPTRRADPWDGWAQA